VYQTIYNDKAESWPYVYRNDLLGNYHTKEEAEKARDDVREFIRNRNKSND
jgi:hypothetical protein